MSKEVKENQLFKILDERLKENDEKGINSIIVLSPNKISIIGLDPVECNYLQAYRKS